jgi:hypothetical protein
MELQDSLVAQDIHSFSTIVEIAGAGFFLQFWGAGCLAADSPLPY